MDPNTQMGTAVYDQAWFQIFWRLMAGALLIVFLLLISRLCRYCQRNRLDLQLRNTSRQQSPAIISNRQATNLWGTAPGIIISGMNTDHSPQYRPADGGGGFGKADPANVVPELQDATQLNLATRPRSALIGPTAVVVAERASSSTIEADEESGETIREAIPYYPRSLSIVKKDASQGPSAMTEFSEESDDDEELANQV